MLLLLCLVAFGADPPELPTVGPAVAEPVERLSFSPDPAAGIETTISVRDADGEADPGETVQVLHRPGLDGERQVAIGITDSRGRVTWTPAISGVAVVRAGTDTQPVAIRWSETPPTTAILLALLACSAMGALGYGVLPRRARRARGS